MKCVIQNKCSVLITVSTFVSCMILFSGCYYDKEEVLYPGSGQVDCTTVPAGFAADVQPLLLSKCALSGCHDAGGASGGVVFENYSQISGKKDRINARAVVEKSMPPTGPLTNAEAAKIKCWLEAGGLNN